MDEKLYKLIKLRNGSYFIDTYVFIGKTNILRKFLKDSDIYFNEKNLSSSYTGAVICCIKNGMDIILVHIPSFNPRTVSGIATITHELLHVSLMVLQRAGDIKYDAQNSEHLCYLHSDLFIQFYNKYKNKMYEKTIKE